MARWIRLRGGLGGIEPLDFDAAHIARADAVALLERAHDACPYSRATRGNVDVTLSVGGMPVA